MTSQRLSPQGFEAGDTIRSESGCIGPVPCSPSSDSVDRGPGGSVDTKAEVRRSSPSETAPDEIPDRSTSPNTDLPIKGRISTELTARNPMVPSVRPIPSELVGSL